MRISDWSSDVCSSDLLKNAPAIAFVDGEIIRGVAELLAAVVRDLVYTAIELAPEYADELGPSAGVTDAVFRLLRTASVLQPADPNLVVRWGGQPIHRAAYQYTQDVGYELGLRSDARREGEAGVRTCTYRWRPYP